MTPRFARLLVLATLVGAAGLVDGARLFGLTLSAHLLIDLNPASSPLGSDPTDFASLPGVAVFAAYDEAAGRELWRTDGTPAGTYRLPESCDGICSRLGRLLWVDGGAAYFESAGGHGLRVTAGAAATTLLLSDELRVALAPHAADGHGGVYFVVHASEGEELWITDRSVAGTRRVLAPGAGAPSGGYSDFALFEGRLYFVARQGSRPPSVWVTDGTPAGTRRLVVGKGLSGPRAARVLGATPHGVVLRLWSSSRGAETWTLDAEDRLLPLDQLSPGADSPRWLWWHAAREGILAAVSTPPFGEEVWSIEPRSGVRRLTNWSFSRAIRQATAGPSSFAWSGGRVLFPAREGAESPMTSLWISDGSPRGTHRLGDGEVLGSHVDPPYLLAEVPGAGQVLVRVGGEGLRVVAGSANAAVDRNFVTVRDEVVFASLGAIWGSQGGGEAVVRLRERPYSMVATAIGGRALCVGSAGADGREPFLLTLDGSGVDLDLNPARSAVSSSPRGFSTLGRGLAGAGRALFGAFGTGQFALWQTDGTPEGTAPVAGATIPGNLGSIFGSAVTEAGTFLVIGRVGFGSDPGDAQLYFVDAVSRQVKRLTRPGTLVAQRAPIAAGERVVFTACERSTGCEPWASDGSADGTRRIADLRLGGLGSSFMALEAQGDQVLGWASVPGSAALWRSDGTPAGTRAASLATAGVFASVATIGSWTYFLQGPNPLLGPCGVLELRRVGDTAQSEQPVAVLDAEYCGSSAVSLAPVEDRLVMLDLHSGVNGLAQRVWISGGTFESTELVAEIPTGGFQSLVPTVVAGRLYFAAGDAGAQVLWTSDGTAAGTIGHPDLVFGAGEYYFSGLVGFAGQALLQVSDDAGVAVWKSDATAAGTQRLVPGELAGAPVGERLYFAGRDEHGLEPWVLEAVP